LRAIASICTTLLLLTMIDGPGPLRFARAQAPGRSGSATNDRDALMSAAVAEEKKGTELSYTQNYHSDHKQVLLKGTLYAAITSFNATKCKLTIDTAIVDRYSGQVDRDEINDTQTRYDSSAEFVLTPEIAGSIQLVEARPGQLETGTHPICDEQRACAIEWLKLETKQPVMRVWKTNNDLAGYNGFVKIFDGMIDRFWIPVSSESAGKELMTLVANFASTCSQ
jgi:hypothetical protein